MEANSTLPTAVLNDREKLALKSQILSAQGNGFDFGYSDDIMIKEFTKHEYAGYTAQFVKKGLLEIDEEFNQTSPCNGFTWDDLKTIAGMEVA